MVWCGMVWSEGSINPINLLMLAPCCRQSRSLVPRVKVPCDFRPLRPRLAPLLSEIWDGKDRIFKLIGTFNTVLSGYLRIDPQQVDLFQSSEHILWILRYYRWWRLSAPPSSHGRNSLMPSLSSTALASSWPSSASSSYRCLDTFMILYTSLTHYDESQDVLNMTNCEWGSVSHC